MSLQACAELVERGDADRFLATMTAPPEARARLFPLYAFNLEVARAPWTSQEPMIAEMRLQFWHDTIDDIGAGRGPGAHEVARELAGVIEAASLPVAQMAGLVAARRWDIYREPFTDQAHFDRYIDETSGNLMWLAARALGAGSTAEPMIRDVAYAAGVANWLRAVPELEARGRIPLIDGRPEGVFTLASGALARLQAATRAGPGVGRETAFALRPGWQAEIILKRAVNEPERVSQGSLGTSEFRRRVGLLWVSALGRW